MEKKGSIDMYAEDPILPDEIGSKKSRREGEAAKSTSGNRNVAVPSVCSCTKGGYHFMEQCWTH